MTALILLLLLLSSLILHYFRFGEKQASGAHKMLACFCCVCVPSPMGLFFFSSHLFCWLLVFCGACFILYFQNAFLFFSVLIKRKKKWITKCWPNKKITKEFLPHYHMKINWKVQIQCFFLFFFMVSVVLAIEKKTDVNQQNVL